MVVSHDADPAEAHPRIVFETLYGEGGSAAERRSALKRRASLLDALPDEITRLQGTLGSEDRHTIDQFVEDFASLRDVLVHLEPYPHIGSFTQNKP